MCMLSLSPYFKKNLTYPTTSCHSPGNRNFLALHIEHAVATHINSKRHGTLIGTQQFQNSIACERTKNSPSNKY